jgi:hypothetical protein
MFCGLKHAPLQCLYHRRPAETYTWKYVRVTCRVKLVGARENLTIAWEHVTKLN